MKIFVTCKIMSGLFLHNLVVSDLKMRIDNMFISYKFLVRLHGEYNILVKLCGNTTITIAITTSRHFMYKKGRVNSNSRIISTDEDPSLRIESSAIINLGGVSTKLNKYVHKFLFIHARAPVIHLSFISAI